MHSFRQSMDSSGAALSHYYANRHTTSAVHSAVPTTRPVLVIQPKQSDLCFDPNYPEPVQTLCWWRQHRQHQFTFPFLVQSPWPTLCDICLNQHLFFANGYFDSNCWFFRAKAINVLFVWRAWIDDVWVDNELYVASISAQIRFRVYSCRLNPLSLWKQLDLNLIISRLSSSTSSRRFDTPPNIKRCPRSGPTTFL